MRYLPASFLVSLSFGLLAACGGGGGGDASGGGSAGGGDAGGGGGGGAVSPPAFVPTTTQVTVTELASGLPNPWGLAFLPDGRMLVTGRTGSLRLYTADGASFTDINLAGLTRLSTDGQGGLLDVALDPAFANNRRVYFTFAEFAANDNNLNGTAVARAQLDTGAATLVDLQVIYRQAPKIPGSGHLGSRLVFDRGGQLFVTLGERHRPESVQALNTGFGKVVRITTDGNAAPGNPVLSGAQDGIWSYGHRNSQGAALHPDTGELWTNEHGPQGGDEVNRTLAGRNYGWPVISHGQQYNTTLQYGEGTARAGMEPPSSVWENADGSPWTSGRKSSTAPSGMAFFTGSQPAHWSRSMFVGALAGQALWRLQFDGARLVGRERLLSNLGERIRDVRQGPDGRLYLLTDSGRLLRVNA